METFPSFSITNNHNGLNTVTLNNTTNGSSFTYILAENEKIIFNGYTKILTSVHKTTGDPLDPNPYASWTNKNYLIFNPDGNTVNVTNSAGTSTVVYSYRAPKIL